MRLDRFAPFALALVLALPVPAGEQDAAKKEAPKKDEAKKEATEKVEKEPSLASVAAAAAERRRQAAAADTVITTEDLQRRFGAGGTGGVYQATGPAVAEGTEAPAAPAEGAVPPPPDPGDPLMALQQQQADAAARARAIEAAEAEVTSLRARIEELERRALAISNPYLPRPKVEEDDEAAEGWDEKSADERRAQTRDAIASAKERLQQAERRLADLRSGRAE